MYCLSSSMTWVFFRADPRASTWLLPPMLLLTVSRSLRAYLLPQRVRKEVFTSLVKVAFYHARGTLPLLGGCFFHADPRVLTRLLPPLLVLAVSRPLRFRVRKYEIEGLEVDFAQFFYAR